MTLKDIRNELLRVERIRRFDAECRAATGMVPICDDSDEPALEEAIRSGKSSKKYAAELRQIAAAQGITLSLV